MRRDPTQFRERFKRWKEGLPAYKNGKPVDDEEFESFRQTLPDNQKPIGAYRTRRYWELNGKPKTFGESIGLGMYNLGDSGNYGQYGIEIPAWHANSVAYDDATGNYEFMKPNSHPTRWMEDVYGYWGPDNQDFRENYKLEKGVVYDKYVPKKNVWKLPKFEDGKPITTGGAGYIPPSNNISQQELRRRFYDHITPAGYSFPISRTVLAAIDPTKVNVVKPRAFNKLGLLRDDIFAEYLQIPKEERHKVVLDKKQKQFHNIGTIEKTSLRPINADDSPHFKIKKLSDFDIDRLIKNGRSLKIGENAVSHALASYLGSHTIGHGFDDTGEYISYYDKWDLSPFTLKGQDQSFGIGTPVHIYDRIYLDDYYNVKEPTHAIYLPEITITPNKLKLPKLDGGRE